MGVIASIANVVFLGGGTRIACPDSYFHFHNYEMNFQSAQSMDPDKLLDNSQSLDAYRLNTRSIFKARTQLTDADLDTLKFLDKPMIKDEAFAQRKGIVQQVAIPTSPQEPPSSTWTIRRMRLWLLRQPVDSIESLALALMLEPRVRESGLRHPVGRRPDNQAAQEPDKNVATA
jgi:hypothetical protein